MKSIKPGRGPSAMGALGSVFVAIFGVFWTIMAGSMGAPIFFVLFGIGFVVLAIVQGVYHYNNATNKNRMSVYDITDQNEEIDPLQARIEDEKEASSSYVSPSDIRFCPYCGVHVDENFIYCPKCGKRVRG